MQSALEKKIRKFLQGPRKGETFELRNGLVSQYRHERKDAIQRVIQAMTVGKDVSSLFPDVLKNIATYDIEQKKLVYLYLMNYSKTHPELCILAVNTFVQDTEDPNPLIRALAIRTMGCIRVQKMVDYMEIPLSRTLKDDNPYVRKTAALCVAKLFDLNPDMCVEYGFLARLQELVNDTNPMVVANALNALYEIREMNTDESLEVITVSSEMAKNLLTCLNECTEWGRITILSSLTEYVPAEVEEAQHIIERIIPQLQHVNPAVVLSSIKAIIAHLDYIADGETKQGILRKLSAPLVSLVSSSIPEAQYVGLKNIRIILERYPSVLSKELRVFFIKYSDPLYLKLEKLDIMVRLANDGNAALLLGELKEYAMEFEPSLVSRAIKSIGTVAIKLSSATVKAINLLIFLLDQRGGELVINETVAVLANILRRYPNKNDLLTLVIPVIANNVEVLDKNDALIGYVFLVGSYPKYFSGLSEKLDHFIETFMESDPSLQLAIITAIVKINMTISGTYSSQLQRVLELATQECENADVRDQAYMYWRLLSSESLQSQQKIILAPLPPIEDTIPMFNPIVLNDLLHELSTIASVYQKPSSTFVENGDKLVTKKAKQNIEDLKNLAKTEIINNVKNENLLDLDDDVDSEALASQSGGSSTLLAELNDLFNTPPPMQGGPQKTEAVQSSQHSQTTQDILNLFD
ncbi:hypothetical protein DIURU_003418 [Diutina rugosa]|uniref:AP complex subunit beta n=1 Tax=Diutina rugosa TaxID=5481 RepID=A0A642UL20_DIURU|nr:uncharacterized protein DIURU_003418 [Diutina rugosa]KAA8901048.1 hypothetical protein DIURU_003418 [Diutina rugosa]